MGTSTQLIWLASICALQSAVPGKALGQESGMYCEVNVSAESIKEALIAIGQQCRRSIVLKSGELDVERNIEVRGKIRVIDAVAQALGQASYEIAQDGNLYIVSEAVPEEPSIFDPGLKLEQPEPRLDRIVVTGTRLQNQLSIRTKRESLLIMDAVSQDEIGRQPDFNVADALRRVAGVNGIREEEESQYLSIRGLNPDFTLVRLDGGIVIGAEDAGRRVSLQAIPAPIASRTEVIKTRSAETDGNSIGGTVNIITRSAFDLNRHDVQLTAYTGSFIPPGNNFEKHNASIRLGAAYSDVFGDADQYGVVFSGSFFQRDQYQERSLNIRYDELSNAPLFPIWNGIENTLTRGGAFAKFEYSPSESFYSKISFNFFGQEEGLIRLSEVLRADPSAIDFISPTRGIVEAAQGQVEYAERPLGLQTKTTAYEIKFNSNDGSEFLFRGSYAASEYDSGGTPDIVFTYEGFPLDLGYAYEFIDGTIHPSISFFDTAAAEDLTRYQLKSYEGGGFFNTSEAFDIEGRVSVDLGNPTLRLTTGGKFQLTDRKFSREFFQFDYVGQDPLLLSEFGTQTNAFPAFSPVALRAVDVDSITDFFQDNPNTFVDQTFAPRNERDDFGIEEKILATYGELELIHNRLEASIGGRIEYTNVFSEGVEETREGFSPISGSGDYWNFLPSLNFAYSLTNDTKVRFGYYRAIGRPDLFDIRAFRKVDAGQAEAQIRQSNTGLKPRIADNLDASIEYYFDGGDGIASLAVFHKEIRDEIFVVSRQLTIGGETITITEPINALAATLTGLEMNFTKNEMDFLPAGFSNIGVAWNYSFVHSTASILDEQGVERRTDRLEEQPEHSGNVSLFYQNGPLELRGSYNYIGGFVSQLDLSAPGEDEQIAAFQSIDLQARYKFSDQFALLAEARNVTGEVSERFSDGPVRLGHEYTEFGPAVFIGITFKN